MDVLGAREASPKFRSVLYYRRLERVNPFWVYEFGVLCQTPGFRPLDLITLMPGLRHAQIERGIHEVAVAREDVVANAASVTREDAMAFMKLGALPSYSVLLVREMKARGMKVREIAAVLGLDARSVKKALGSGRLALVEKS